ncbi:MAG: phage major tail tube protein [Synergistaceae bacterium]|nr:phage major tail tube protein [Synergistaceae bacterium]MBQ7220000.1 phage major tail tube protein [Synergistaceae bacterium]
MPNLVPEKITKFNVYTDGDRQLGVAEITLPPLEFMTTEIKGAGVAGTMDSPGGGQFASLVCTLNWRITTEDVFTLLEPRGHELDLYGEQLEWDAGNGEYVSHRFHLYIRALTKKLDLGKFGTMETQDGSSEHELYYLKIDIDGTEQVEIDKMNYIFKVQGYDWLANTRRNIGMM